MIIREKVKVKWHGRTRKHYERLGYEYTKKDEAFYVYADELSKGSNIVVKFVCDYCGNEGRRMFYSLKNKRKVVEKDCCSSCTSAKHYETLLISKGSLESNFPKIAKEWCSVRNEIPASKVTSSSGRKGKWVCSKGHRWEASVYSRTDMGTGCPICSESRGEVAVSKALENLKIDYKREVFFDELIGEGGGNLRFDFGIYKNHSLKGLIEYDGEYHFRKLFEGDGHERIVKHDQIKEMYCEDNSIPLLRIPHTEFGKVGELVNNFVEELSAEGVI